MSGRINRFFYLILVGIPLILILPGCKNPLVSVIDEEVAVAITPPEVVSNFPEKSADDVPINLSTITVTLTKYIDPTSVSSSTFYVSDPSGNPVSGSRSVENESITFSPNSSLSVGTVYTVIIDGIRDLDGNYITEKYSWSFTTGIEGDTVRPTISSMVINGGEAWTNSGTVTVHVDATDNFGIAQMNVSTTGSFSDADWVPWSGTFTLNLPAGDGIKHVYLKLKDGSGLETANYTSASIGLDTTGPVVALFSIDGGNSGTKNSAVSIDILGVDEDGGSGMAEYRLHTEGADWGAWAALTDGSISLSNQALTVSTDETEVFYLQVSDTAGNISDVQTEEITLDLTAPEVDSALTTPTPNSTVPLNQAYVKVVFDGEMNTSTITADTVYVARGATKISTPLYSLTDGNSAIEFSYFEDGGDQYFLEQNTSYTVFISSAVTDIAGNNMSSDYSYYFTTNSAVDTQAPEGSIVLDLDNPDFNATKGQTTDLQIRAEDDYNGVRAVKFWGDGGTGMPIFETDATWILYNENAQTAGAIDYMSFDATDDGLINQSREWLLSNTGGASGDRYIYYRFSDFAGNESPVPGRLKINQDNTNPVLNSVQINNGNGYTTNGTVNIAIDATDSHSGLNEMRFSLEAANAYNPSPTLGVWEDWLTLKTGYDLTTGGATGEGQYYLYTVVRDRVDLESSMEYTSVILDYTDPLVSFGGTDILETNSRTLQTSTIVDPDPGASNYQVPSGIAEYAWEQVSGPGTLSFWTAGSGGTDGSGIQQPYIQAGADDGTQDGTYEIKLTVTDNAGNSSYASVPFYWDTIDPGDVGTITAYHQDGTVLTTSGNPAMTYTTSAQPYATWNSTAGADYYIIIGGSTDPTGSMDPYVDPGVPRTIANRDNGTWYPFWADPDADWDNSTSYESWGYMRQNIPYLSAPAPSSPGNNDGPIYLSFTAWDDAGNMSNNDPGTDRAYIKFWIDTLSPVITNVQTLDPHNIPYEINFKDTSGGDGLVYDQKTQADPGFSLPSYSYEDDKGSGIASYLWEQTAGPAGGTLTIVDSTTISPLVSAADDGSEDGQYELKLTVTDVAGNVSSGYLTFIWDTTRPEPVTVTGPDQTPDLTPTWSWTSGGGGNGTYEYQLVVSGNEPDSAGWTSTTNTFFTPASNLVTKPDKGYFTLYVREYDDAGNYSDELNVLSSHEVYVDWEFITAPTVTRSGNYLRNIDTSTVTWSIGSGIGEPASEYYRYWIEDSSGNPVMYGSGDSAQVIGPFAPGTATVNVNLSAYEGVYYIKVQEYDFDNYPSYPNPLGWPAVNDFIGSSAVNLDITPPVKPNINTSYTTGGSTTYNGYHLSKDTTPLFYWSSGGGGIGTYRWSFDETDPNSWTQTNYYYVYTSNAEGFYTFYVQERDTAGNWSDSEEFNLEIDTTAPTLNSITLKNRHANAVDDTSYTVSSYVDIEVSGSGANLKTHPAGDGGDVARMYFYNYGGSASYTPVSGSPVTKESWNLGTGDGGKQVYCYLWDYAGNVSVTKSDGITLDTASPAVSSFNINNGAVTATNRSVTLSSSYSGANWMRIRNIDSTSDWSEWFTASSSKAWTLSDVNGYNGYGAKKVAIQFTDEAGYTSRNSVTDAAPHYTEEYDSIFYQQPIATNAWKGNNSSGYIYLYYENFPSDTGNNNTFYIYTATSPTGTKTLKSTTTNLSSFYSTFTEGQLYYFFIRAYNPDVGDFTNYSNYEIGYSSDMTVIYDDDDTVDTSLASVIKQWITRKWVDTYPTSYAYGPWASSMPDYTVTLVPEDEVSNVYSSENMIYGDPVIITPGTSWDYLNKLTRITVPYLGKIRNIADTNRGVLAMHYAGYKFLKYTVENWSAWGLGDAGGTLNDTAPTNLDSVYDHGYQRYAGTTTYSSVYDYIWYRYIKSISLYDNYRYDTEKEELMFTVPTEESYSGSPNGGAHQWSIYNSGASGTNDTYFYADDPDYTNYYTVARQGRFIYWGYNKIPAYVNGGIPFFYNTIRFLKSYF